MPRTRNSGGHLPWARRQARKIFAAAFSCYRDFLKGDIRGATGCGFNARTGRRPCFTIQLETTVELGQDALEVME